MIISKIMIFNFMGRQYRVEPKIIQRWWTIYHRYEVSIIPNEYFLYSTVRKDLSECHIWARTQIEYNERAIRQLKETEERQRLERIENYNL